MWGLGCQVFPMRPPIAIAPTPPPGSSAPAPCSVQASSHARRQFVENQPELHDEGGARPELQHHGRDYPTGVPLLPASAGGAGTPSEPAASGGTMIFLMKLSFDCG
jgi:hypothetical protein